MKNKIQNIVGILMGLAFIIIGIRKTYVEDYANYTSALVGLVAVIAFIIFMYKK